MRPYHLGIVLMAAACLLALLRAENVPKQTSDTAQSVPLEAGVSEENGAPEKESGETEEAEAVTPERLPYEAPPPPQAPEGGWNIFVVPIEGPITSPQLYILRRALKEAIEKDIDVVLIDMDTPGGELGVTLEMMEALDKFEGKTITYVNPEAISAGSYISISTDDIYFAPSGIMGAAEAVTGTGENINESMQRKIESYLRAKVRVLSKEHRYRAQVQRAMMDPDYVLEIDGEVLKEEGELLSLTADEAILAYGDPPQPLLATGIAVDVDDLLTQRYGEGNYTVRNFEVTWSEKFAKWFKTIAPALLGIGFLMVFIEIKTPNFGIVGGIGIGLVLLVFLSNYFAGMAGHIEVIVFIIGVLLVVVEVFVLPGTLLPGALGAIMMAGALLWAMADIWPTPDGGYTVNWSSVEVAIRNLLIGAVIALLGMVLLWRFLKGTGMYRHVVSEGHVGGLNPVAAGGGRSAAGKDLPAVGTEGLAVTDLRPLGTIEIDGNRFNATVGSGQINRGKRVRVIGRASFALKVEELES